ncbi:TetR family transcriptional regulator [Nonomuraea angiospora]|uniref:TetR/AcrR family transcriptional regulator n=1 Tax=Nonomuraea angiospora TaxID=46172 RepID=UPI00344F361C
MKRAFVRARRPEHKQQRREEILAAARDLAVASGVRNVSLGAVAEAVGLAKSNIMRYFGTREEIYLILAADEWHQWAAAVTTRLEATSAGVAPDEAASGGVASAGVASAGVASDGGAPDDAASDEAASAGGASDEAASDDAAATVTVRLDASSDHVVAALAETLADRPLLCDILSQTATTLEHNVSIEAARTFKRTILAVIADLGSQVARATGLTVGEGTELVSVATAFAGILYPIAHPSPTLAELYAQDPVIAATCPDFLPTLTRALKALAAGLPTLRED